MTAAKPTPDDISAAFDIIAAAERDLRYHLTDGQRGDLLADNRNDWSLEFISAIIKHFNTSL